MKTIIGFIVITIMICLLTVTIFCIWNFSFVNWQLVSQVVNTTCVVSGTLFIAWLCCRIFLTEERYIARENDTRHPRLNR
jgi:hypothetical protein